MWAGWRWLGPDADERDALARAIDDVVEAEMEAGHISGVSVAVARGLRVIHARGYGYADLENSIPADAETLYRIGSITKQFTSATVMSLVEDGLVRLDAPVTEYLPGFPGLAGVTIDELLSHTSGVKNYTTMTTWWEQLGQEMTPASLASFFVDAPLDFQPGSRFAYSNSGYVLLGMVIEAVTGRPYGGVLNERILVPTRLDRTLYCDDARLVPDRARGYQVVDGDFRNAPYVSISQAYSAGGICSTALDLARWTRALALGTVVDGHSYEAMSTPKTLRDGSRIEYGYGLAVGYLEGRHRVTHIGGMLGFTGQLSLYDEDGLTVVVLTNTEGANAAKIESDIARVVLELGEREDLDLPLSEQDMAVYAGVYDLGLTRVEVLPADGRLNVDVDLPGVEGRYVLLNQGDHAFLAEEDPEIAVTFTVENGRATGFVLVRRGITMPATRVE